MPKKWLIIFPIAMITIIVLYSKGTNKTDNNDEIIEVKITESKVTTTKIKYKSDNNIQCYRILTESLKDISEITPRKGKSIFFHETSCKSYEKGKLSISSRQACSVESAAKMNPNLDIYLLYSSPGVFKFEGDESDKFLEVLLGYGNVKIMHLDYGKYTKGTPVEDLYASGKLEQSKYVVSHASDVLRFLTLWKYGGIYLDLDVLVIKSLEDIPLNFAGSETDSDVGSAVLSFDADGNGHLLADNCVQELKNNFNGDQWVHNGPGLIKRILQSACNENESKDMVGKECKGFTVFPQHMFYPLPFMVWNKYMDESFLDEVLNITKNSSVVHIWNKLSAITRLPLTSNAPYINLAREYCPKVIAACSTDF